MEFRLLGEVDALVDGRRVDVGHARQRSVLAALLVDVNRPVTADQLIDRVWADEPPYRARNALSAYLSRLRQRLAGDPAVRIARGPAGYALTADPMSVDLHRFRHLAGQARSTGPAALFDEALGLWRGDPFATIDTPWFDGVRTALHAERRAVVLDRNDAALQAGRHRELLVELAAHVTAHPLDERLAGQLMLALFRSGRQADALAVFQRVRDRLRDELGADPGAALRRVHQEILTGDAEVATVTAEPPHPRPAGNLPRRATSFVGREVDVAQVVAAVRHSPLVTLTGVGGVGKSRLAVEAATRDQGRFADGAWLCELSPLADGGPANEAVAVALRVQQRQGLTIEETVIEYLRTREVLLVLDNCEHVLDPVVRLLEQVVARCPRVAVLATSREPLGVDGERVRPVEPLSARAGAALFVDRARAGRPDFHPDADEAGAVTEICRRLDGLPLAIELAAARVRVMNAAEVARRLDSGRFLSRRRTRGAQPHHESLDATVGWSYRLLSRAEQTLFARLSVFAGGFDLEAAHGVCGDPGGTEDDTLDVLGGLVDKSMVTVESGAARSRYRLLETLRGYARERLREADLAAVFERAHAAFFARFAERLAGELHGRDEQAWVERGVADYDNLRAAFERAVADRDGDLALRLVASVSELVHLRVGYEPAGWALRAVELADDRHRLTAAAIGIAARGAWNRGEFAEARHLAERARGRAPGRGTARVAYPADVLADLALYEGAAPAALRHYAGEVARAREEDDPIRLVWTLYYVAVCHAVLREPGSGVPAALEAFDVAEAIGNATARSMARYAVGLVLKKSEPQRALVLFDEAAGMAASVRNFWWEGIALMEAAATRAVHGDAAAAARAFVVVLDHWDRVGDWTQQWLNLRYIARLLVRLGAEEDAVALHHALVAAGKPSPLGVPGPATEATLSGAAAVRRARSRLAAQSAKT